MTTKGSRRGILLMALGVIAVAIALALVFYSNWSKQQAEENVTDSLERLEALIPEEHAGEMVSSTDEASDASSSMPAIDLDGRSYIGILRIPSLSLELPIQVGWSDRLLRFSPCRYSGSVYDGSLIIVGRDYQSHFGRLSSLAVGDTVSFTDVDGQVFSCRVTGIENPTEVDEDYLASGTWDMTLYVYLSSDRRYEVVRCMLA